jgi:tRNA (guanine37-N1)-methyltransferase
VKFIRVENKDAQRAKGILSEKGIIDNEYDTMHEDEAVLFPINDEHAALQAFLSDDINTTIVFRDAQKKEDHGMNESLKESLKESYGAMRRGFDIIGDIAIIEETQGYEDKAMILAEAIMSHHKNVKSVFMKEGIHGTEYRIQRLKHILGDNRRETMHVENGYRIFLEVGETYFSPRLSSERLRIARNVRDNEDVLVLFSGVAPYGIAISRHSNARMIYCVELNPKAHKYALINVERNKVRNVECMLADANIATKDFEMKGIAFDRIVMPLPKTADAFIPQALPVLKESAIIHWYSFCDEDDIENTIRAKLDSIFPGRADYELLHIQKAGQSSPGIMRVCADIMINRLYKE